jgi:hypothetical protein
MRGTALRPPAATGRRADRRALDALLLYATRVPETRQAA